MVHVGFPWVFIRFYRVSMVFIRFYRTLLSRAHGLGWETAEWKATWKQMFRTISG